MKFSETTITGAFEILPDPHCDARGFFTRTWCEREAVAHGLEPRFVQCNISFNSKKGTLRGMHFQAPPYEEAKLVRCTMGAIYDVIVDLRPDSLTMSRWFATELTATNRIALYVPKGCAHGFQTLVDETEVFYQMSEFYYPESASGIRWDDPAFGIHWPDGQRIISEQDQNFPLVSR